MASRGNIIVSILKKLGLWFSAFVILSGIFFIYLFPDFFYPKIPWETGTDYNYQIFSRDPNIDYNDLKIDIISLYEDVRWDGDEVYGVQSTLFNRNLVHALEDQNQIKKFWGIVHDADQGLKGSTNCSILKGQKEIHVVTFDYENSKAGYFFMHFCKVDDQFITLLTFLDDNWTSLVLESAEMTEFLGDLGIEPNE